jgi:Flp pilus assembly protein TadB
MKRKHALLVCGALCAVYALVLWIQTPEEHFWKLVLFGTFVFWMFASIAPRKQSFSGAIPEFLPPVPPQNPRVSFFLSEKDMKEVEAKRKLAIARHEQEVSRVYERNQRLMWGLIMIAPLFFFLIEKYVFQEDLRIIIEAVLFGIISAILIFGGFFTERERR